ncbi:hypothetical protein JM946_21085 [Steroidobacter sp. S1-65]|uniref:Uncharacterized protein n=1 Tax=Steroidobacter gossypii TaxID=2805490 RepID=A0ABS1X1Y2_9GAMM|nr:hypothetical protein [Steroidobacter gossypii]MBM0107239.1 hypothetical protein [Steroidobacter gossypii]
MKLEVMSISFLRSGALSVEVGAQSQKDAPTEPSLDVVKMWVYLPSYNKTDSMADILEAALNIARQSLR